MYSIYFYVAPNCFDTVMNGDERGTDCGGACVRICALDVKPLIVSWADSFKITDGQYNAVAYIQNDNVAIGTPTIGYTFKLYDAQGLIVEQKGITEIPGQALYPIFEGRIPTGARVPTRTELVFDTKDVVWLPATTESEYRVNTYDLTSADRMPRLTADVRNEALEEAKDVEIVATIFDSKKKPLTASRTNVQYFQGRTNQNVTFTWPEPIATTLRSCEVPTDVVLAIDLSGSMNSDSIDPPQPLTSVLGAARSFVSRLKDHDQIGLVTYATKASIAEALTLDAVRVANTIASLTIEPKEETGSTNTGDALKQMTEVLSSTSHNQDARKVAILLTDGLATAPKDNPDAYAIEQATALKETGAQLFTIGIGASLNETLLRDLASSPTQFYKAPSIGEVDRIYSLITAAICEDGPTIIDIIPKVDASFPSLE